MRAGDRLTVVVVAAAVGVGLAACGGSGDPADHAATQPPTTGSEPTTPATVESTTAIASTTEVASTTAAPATTEATATTEAPAPGETTTTTQAPPVDFDLATLPDLISGLDDAVATSDPLDLAVRLGGFPYEIPVPDGSTIVRLDSVVRADAGSFDHDFSYSAVAPGGTVPDIDTTIAGNGPGSVAVVETWDPIMVVLGFERANSTASDPGSAGGPSSVNHVYVPSGSAPDTVNGLPSTAGNVFVWSREDLTGAASGLDATDPVGGYQIDAGAELDSVGVPLLAAIMDALPLPDGTQLASTTLRLETRSPEAFEVDRGIHYVPVSLEFTASPEATIDELAAFYADPSIFRSDVLLPAEASFFEEGTYEPAPIAPYGDTDQRLPLLLLRRYEGALSIQPSSDADGPVVISYDLTLNPNDAELAPPAG